MVDGMDGEVDTGQEHKKQKKKKKKTEGPRQLRPAAFLVSIARLHLWLSFTHAQRRPSSML